MAVELGLGVISVGNWQTCDQCGTCTAVVQLLSIAYAMPCYDICCILQTMAVWYHSMQGQASLLRSIARNI